MDTRSRIPQSLRNHGPLLLILGYFLVFYTVFVIWKTSNFLQPALDYAYFDQFIWKYSRLKEPIATLGIPINLLAQHLHLILLLLAPFYLFFSSPSLLGILDVLFVVASIIPVYMIAENVLKDRPASLIIAFLYGNFIGIQFAIDFQFHEITLFLGFFLWAFHFLLRKDWKAFYIFVVLCLLCKENVGLYLFFFGIYVFFAQKERKHGAAVSILGILWLLLALKVIIPYFRDSPYIYFTYTAIGSNPQEFIINTLKNPLIIVKTLMYPLKKAKTLFVLFASGGFLAFLSPLVLIISIPMVLERFLNDMPHMWQLSQHYNASIAVVVALGMVYGLKTIGPKTSKRLRYGILSVLVCINLVLSFRLVTPYRKLFVMRQSLSVSKADKASVANALSKIPGNASIAGVSGLVSHFSKRDDIQYLPKGIGEKQYIIVNWNIKEFWPYDSMDAVRKDVSAIRKSYEVVSDDGMTVVFRKTSSIPGNRK